MPDSSPSRGPADPAALIVRAAAGDEGAWRDLIALYGRRVYAMARSRCRRDDLAEEITQSVFVTVAGQLSTGSYSERGRFESWLFRVTMNRVRDEVRRRQRHAAPTDALRIGQSVEAPVTMASTAQDDLEALREAMGTLADADRDVVELRHHAGLSFKQIAETLDEPIGTILARHHRALRKLKETIEQLRETVRRLQ